jgi:hypothetical protein
MRILSSFAVFYLLASFLIIPSQAGVEVVASKSLTVQPGGPRSGDAGSWYLNIEAVAATYFGASENDKEKSPRLALELP